MPLFGSFTRQNPLTETLENSGLGDDVKGAAFDGIDAAVGNVISAPNIKTIPELGRDLIYEAFPGPQQTSLDIGSQEANLKASDYLRKQGPLKSSVKQGVQKQAGNLRETGLEKGANALARSGTKAFSNKLLRKAGERLAATTARTAAGTAASGGLLAPLLGVWAGADYVDTGISIATGKSIGDWAQNPEKIRGRSGAQRAIEEERMIRDEMTANEERPFGTEAVLGGKPVMWGGDDYGWQSPESFKNIKRY